MAKSRSALARDGVLPDTAACDDPTHPRASALLQVVAAAGIVAHIPHTQPNLHPHPTFRIIC
jgi:hypothetical protein